MPFHTGRVSFCRFIVRGDAPGMVDDAVLATLAQFAFNQSNSGNPGAPGAIESGFTTGEHLFDTQFDFHKNSFAPDHTLLLASLRVDTHDVPSDVKHAYQIIQERASLKDKDNPTGFLSRREKRDAKEQSQRQLHDEVIAGKYRKSKAVPLLWDLKTGHLYFAATGVRAIEQLNLQLRDAFNVDIEPLTAGSLAGEWLSSQGRHRDYEDLKPSPLTAAPEEAYAEGDDFGSPRDPATPLVQWTYGSTDTKDFLGNEFLIWLWHRMEADEGLIGDTAITIDKALDMECAWGVRGKLTLRGDGPTRLPEAADALLGGKWPRKISLILADTREGSQWELSLQGDKWHIGSAALPAIEDAASPRDLVDARLASIRQLTATIDTLYRTFIDERTAGGWANKRQRIRDWIKHRNAAPQSVIVDAT
jgi:hypothetical protein